MSDAPKAIPLTRGLFAIVDSEDYALLSEFKWSTLQSGTGPMYAARKIRIGTNKRQVLLMHRVITNAKHGEKVDHRNGNSLDNRRENLRIATDQQNQRAFKTPRKNKTSQFRGVHFRKITGRWIAQICVDKKVLHLGCFDSESDAALAYNEAAKLHFGEFAHLNNVATTQIYTHVIQRGGCGVISPLDRI